MRNMIAALAVGCATSAYAAPAELSALDWLKGDWVGVGVRQDHGTGGFTFERAAGGQVLLQKNFADYPAEGGKPAQHHGSLMVVYPEGGVLRAMQWDNEGHTLHFAVTEADPGAVVMVTDDPTGPRYRLSYRRTAAGLDGSFEMAPPTDRDKFGPYLTWSAKKRSDRR